MSPSAGRRPVVTPSPKRTSRSNLEIGVTVYTVQCVHVYCVVDHCSIINVKGLLYEMKAILYSKNVWNVQFKDMSKFYIPKMRLSPAEKG